MLPRVLLWPVRFGLLAFVGILTFAIPYPGATGQHVKFVCFVLSGVGLLGWALIELTMRASRLRSALLVPVLIVIAAAAGFGSLSGEGGNGCIVTLSFIAASGAAAETGRLATWTVVVASILSIDANWIFWGFGYQNGKLANGIVLTIVPLTGVLVSRILRHRRIEADQAATLLAQNQLLEAEQRRADVLGERARIAREIHDVLAHSLGALGIQIQAARAVLTDHRDADRAIEVLLTAQRIAADGLAETRRAVHALRADTMPLPDELKRVIETHGKRYRAPVALRIGGEPAPLPPDATVALLRTAQEALVNSAKHAEGRPVDVDLDYGEQRVRLTVANDLARNGDTAARGGTPATVNGGYGLTGLQERLLLLNGRLVAGPHDGRWTLTAELPLAAELPQAPPRPETAS